MLGYSLYIGSFQVAGRFTLHLYRTNMSNVPINPSGPPTAHHMNHRQPRPTLNTLSGLVRRLLSLINPPQAGGTNASVHCCAAACLAASLACRHEAIAGMTTGPRDTKMVTRTTTAMMPGGGGSTSGGGPKGFSIVVLFIPKLEASIWSCG